MSSTAKIRGGVAEAMAHDSARLHVTGAARYCDDIQAPAGLAHACLGLAEVAHGRIVSLDLAAVEAAPGVLGMLTATDILGANDISPTGCHDEPVFAVDEVLFHGQPLFAVVAETRDAARRAARLAVAEIAPLPAILDLDAARAAGGKLVTEPLTLALGEARAAIAAAPRRLAGCMAIGGQDHFYLEGHIALALPGEDGEVAVFSSTQHPSEVQHMVAHVLRLPSNRVTVEVRRMGGAFGGKETQSNLFAAVAALAAVKLDWPVKLRPDRDGDMVTTGKRHDMEVGFDEAGNVLGVEMTFAARCGFSADLSGPVTDRTLFHADNCYHWPAARLTSEPLMTHTVSNTAFRGFGGPQGMLAAERVIEEVAFALGEDPLNIRERNVYGDGARSVTPYHQRVEDNIAPRLVAELAERADYRARRDALCRANADSPVIKRGLALTPVKFGISFTTTHFNQAGALGHVYADGSVRLNHGDTEMGQWLYMKVAQMVAEEFQIDVDRVRIIATTTDKVPNTSATAASSGSDLNGMAVRKAARAIRERLTDFAAESRGVGRDQVSFLPGRVRAGNAEVAFDELVRQAYMARVQLSATGF